LKIQIDYTAGAPIVSTVRNRATSPDRVGSCLRSELQFAELYGFRHSDSSLRIPRAVDRRFNHPKGADESSIKALIDQHRAAAMAKLEGEVLAA
jgi:hypothetical protein